MLGFKQIALALLSIAACAACGGAPPPQPAKPVSPGPGADPELEVPDAIPGSQRGAWEARLFALSDAAKTRVPLRDRLAESIAASFEATPEDKLSKRVELFREGMSLNAPADFADGDVAPALAPLAKWVVARYERRGDEVMVLAGLRYLALVEPGDARHGERFLELAEWSEGVRETIPDRLESRASTADLYLRVARLVPDREIVERAAEHLVGWNAAYMARIEDAGADLWGLPPFALREAEKIPVFLAYVFFLNGDATRAAPWIRKLKSDVRSQRAFEELLDGLGEGGEDAGERYFTLAQLFGSFDPGTGQFVVGDPMAGLRACLLARRAEPSPRYPMCVGQFFELLDRPESAVPFYVEAARLAPDESTYLGVTARVRNALSRVHMLERVEEAEAVIRIADELVDSVLALEDVEDESLYQVTAQLLNLSGEVEYADGRIERAIAHFSRACEVWPSDAGPVFRLAEIREMLGEPGAAMRDIETAIARAKKAGGMEAEYWPARAYELRGRIREGEGDAPGAAADFRRALSIWEKADLPLDYAAEIALRRGIALDHLGDEKGALEWMRRAIGLDPENRSVYGAAFSFLFARGRLDSAAELFQIAFNQDRLGAMWKIYFALWIDGLARRQGRTNELARNYLAHADGDTWQDDLARHLSGRIDAAELRRRAGNNGQRVEADFYAGLRLLGDGKGDLARPLFERVIDSKLMGFFEYPMARVLLAEKSAGR
ncbi:MAG: tetratricopeptide repeat protein [Proteobacteria bacterium]|jgi:tetratricopeptide (TPR) repeat protein|nr:tetratricopeptide repeat protein [Pseudomonadota bacterium]